MDRVLNPKDEKQSIYELYRACRLCGAGAGYKMPIIQNVVDLDGDGVELRQKILECVQIEVNHTDRMPPLICELCVDKVNDFYQFLDMCRQTNKRTRLRLGLPLKTRPQGSPDSDNCILGVIEPVYQDDSDGEPLGQKSKRTRIKKEPPEPKETKIKSEIVRPSPKPRGSRESSVSSEEPRFREPWRRSRPPTPGLRRTGRQRSEISPETEGSSQTSGLKRLREKSTKVDSPTPVKKIKLAPEPTQYKPGPKSSKNPKETRPPSPNPSPPPTRSSKPLSRKDRKRSPTPPKPSPPKTKISLRKTNSRISSLRTSVSTKTAKDDSCAVNTHSKAALKSTPPKTAPTKTAPIKTAPIKTAPTKSTPVKTAPTKVDVFICDICNTQVKNHQSLMSHCTHKHLVSVISAKYACNACELWFHTVDEAARHHRDHRDQNIPYKCTRCYGYFKLHQSYEDHFGEDLCLSTYEVPDVKCEECWRTFPTSKLLEDHRCPGADGRAGGKCGKCGRNYALLKNLTKHEGSCNYRKKGEVIVDPEIRGRLLQMTVRVARCDALLAGKRVSATAVSHKYGLDSKCTYPYLKTVNVKTEPSSKLNHMVSINDEIKEEFCTNAESWYSDDSNSSQKTVDSLSNMSLKVLAKKCSIKGPKRKVKSEDSMTDAEISKKIDSIIVNLGNEDSLITSNYDSDSILDINNTKDGTDTLKGNIDIKLDELKDDSQTSFESDSILGKNDSDVAINYEQATSNDNSESIKKSVESSQGDTRTNTNCSDSNNEEDIKDLKVTTQNVNENDINNDSNKQLVQNNKETDVTEHIDNEDNNTSNVDITNNASSEKNYGLCKESENIDGTSKLDTNYDIDVRDDFDKRSPNNEDLSKIDEITNKILQETESNDLDADNIKENSTDTVCVNGVNRADEANSANDEKLLELDAQIANETKVEKKPFSINDLLRKPDVKPLDLDAISEDEFSFDV